MELETLNYTMREAAKRFGMGYTTFAKHIRLGNIRPPVRIIGDGPKPPKYFPKATFDKFCAEYLGVDVDPRRATAGGRK